MGTTNQLRYRTTAAARERAGPGSIGHVRLPPPAGNPSGLETDVDPVSSPTRPGNAIAPPKPRTARLEPSEPDRTIRPEKGPGTSLRPTAGSRFRGTNDGTVSLTRIRHAFGNTTRTVRSSRNTVHTWSFLNGGVATLIDRGTLSHTTFIELPLLRLGMYAVSSSESRIGGRTSADVASTFTFGKFFNKLTARGPNWTNWPTLSVRRRSVRYRPPHHPSASGHGHRP